MNCKPGDLAIRIHVDDRDSITLGCIVRVLKLYPGLSFGVAGDGEMFGRFDVWHCELRGSNRGHLGLPLGIPDAHLRPIRDPGDDAVDETLQRLPAPQRDKEMV